MAPAGQPTGGGVRAASRSASPRQRSVEDDNKQNNDDNTTTTTTINDNNNNNNDTSTNDKDNDNDDDDRGHTARPHPPVIALSELKLGLSNVNVTKYTTLNLFTAIKNNAIY